MEKNHSLKNQRGQVALFVALIFQVLFIFFAMIVNVGLLVHHKINLQNSVDLAAYYGAMKQAEMLNAIGHVNYQIRQSFKLLNFRYHQLGSAGLTGNPSGLHPFRSGDVNGISQILRERDEPFRLGTAFCMAYEPWDIIRNRESYCKEPRQLPIPRLGVPTIVGNPQTQVEISLADFAVLTNLRSEEFCRFASSVNYMQLAKFIAAYKYDVRNRKKLLLSLANEISKENPRDIQGENIRDGVFQTLYKNLSTPNKESLGRDVNAALAGNPQANFKFFNSFAAGNCGGKGNPLDPPGWLAEILIFPLYTLIDGLCPAANGNVVFQAQGFNWSALGSPQVQISNNLSQQARQAAQDLLDLIQDPPVSSPERRLFRSSIGFEKNPWCVGYVGVSATTTPKIPFTPLGDVTMKARAFAKPFGGRIGPWFSKRWSTVRPESTSDPVRDKSEQTDPTLPFRVTDDVQLPIMSGTDLRDPAASINLEINHGRYLGDRIGIFSELTMAHFAQAIHRIAGGGRIVTGWWNHIFDQNFDNPDDIGDPLSWDMQANAPPPMRDIEINAIAPDQFDAATYSIDPDFYNNYLVKIKRGYGGEFNFALRGDLGSRMRGTPEQMRYSIRNQIAAFSDSNRSKVDTQSKLTYYLNKFGQVLTAWQQRTPDAYVLDDSRFGQCLDQGGDVIRQDGPENFHTIGSCKAGGRVGYSVKLVDGLYLSNQPGGYSLGGQGVVGNILNMPPADF